MVQVSGSVNGGWLARATCHMAVKYMIGTIATASSRVAAPSFICTSRRPAATSWVWATTASIHSVNTPPWTSTAGGSEGLGRG
jgi:hypothetical protein